MHCPRFFFSFIIASLDHPVAGRLFSLFVHPIKPKVLSKFFKIESLLCRNINGLSSSFSSLM